MAQYISNGSSYKTVNGTSYADEIRNYSGTSRVTVNAGAGNDTILNWGTYSKIDAGSGNDSIYSFAWYTTINAGTGNDTVSLYSGGHDNVIHYANGDGNDVIYNWSENDTISITGASGYSRSTVGSDVVLEVGNGKITLKGAKGKTVNVKFASGVIFNNILSNHVVNGTANVDKIENTGNHVTINAGAGNDSILNTFSNGVGGDYVLINGGAGSDTIRNNQGFYDTISGGDGSDYIYSYRGKNSSINGGAGSDLISLSGDAVNVTVNGGAGADKISLSGSDLTVKGGTGNDTLYFGGSKNIIQYASGDGNDLIYNWSANDTISITGASYTRSTVGSDVVLKVGTGAVTLKGAKNSTVNVKGTLASGGNSTTPAPQNSGNVIYGTNGHDSLINAASRYSVKSGISIYGFDGNDTVTNYGKNVYISGGTGNDYLYSANTDNVTVNGDDGHDDINVSGANAKIYCGNGDDKVVSNGSYSVIEGGNGNDNLRSNSGDNVSIYGGTGNDYIRATGNYNPNRNGFLSGGDGNDTIVTQIGTGLSISGGKGNDRISLQSSSASCVIAYNSGDGSDTVTGFDGNDTLKVYGSYTRSTVGNDVVVKVGSGSITLKNAKGQTLNISNLTTSSDLASSADLANDDWISADDNNFVTNDTRLDSIVEVTATDYSVGKFDSASTALTAKNILVTFTGKK